MKRKKTETSETTALAAEAQRIRGDRAKIEAALEQLTSDRHQAGVELEGAHAEAGRIAADARLGAKGADARAAEARSRVRAALERVDGFDLEERALRDKLAETEQALVGVHRRLEEFARRAVLEAQQQVESEIASSLDGLAEPLAVLETLGRSTGLYGRAVRGGIDRVQVVDTRGDTSSVRTDGQRRRTWRQRDLEGIAAELGLERRFEGLRDLCALAAEIGRDVAKLEQQSAPKPAPQRTEPAVVRVGADVGGVGLR